MRRIWVTSPSYGAAINLLIEARKAEGLSQRDLAERLGKPRSFVSKLENKERRLDMVELVAVARALGREPTDLIDAIARAMPEPLEF